MKAPKDRQISDSRGMPVGGTQVAGAGRHSGLSIPYERGVLTEMLRPEWDASGQPVLHVSQVRLFPGVISAWHMHERTTDRVFVNQGHMKVVLFDGRADSKTHGVVEEIYAGDARPLLVVIPPGVWHGIQNLGSTDGMYINLASHPYAYEQPDHSRLPFDCAEIPYRWGARDPTTRRPGY